MNLNAKKIQNTYIALTLTSTFATAFIWGINTLFLLDAGLNNYQAFAANAFFTLGSVVFEIPTGVIADVWGRRKSFLLGTITLAISTFIYLIMWSIQGPFIGWALASLVLGLGYTFFSGATDAWLVDALNFTKYKGELDDVFAKGQVANGIAMLTGSVAGGFIAQVYNLAVPYLFRIGFLLISFVTAFIMMKDLGFKPEGSKHPLKAMKEIFTSSIEHGIRNRPVRWMMLTAPFTMGILFYVFYAMQPYLLKLWGNPEAYGVAGLAAATVAGAQILGGLSVKYIRKVFTRRSTALGLGIVIKSVILLGFGITSNFWLALVLLVIWAMVFAASQPMIQSYLNGLIPSKQRATVLSFSSLLGSSGGIATQPALGRVADVYSYSTSFIISGFVQIAALPFILLVRKESANSDFIKNNNQ